MLSAYPQTMCFFQCYAVVLGLLSLLLESLSPPFLSLFSQLNSFDFIQA